MPWHMEPSGTKGLVYVVDDKGKRYEDKPIPKWRAKKQMAALYAAEPEKKDFTDHSGVMVALPVPEAALLVAGLSFPANAEVLPPWEMHVTLSFLGDVGNLTVKPEKLFSLCETLAANTPPVIGKINGYGVFNETHMDGKECVWLSFDAPALPELRQNLLKVLSQNGINIETNHGFTPHITVAYYPKGEEIPKLEFEPPQVLVKFLRVAWADMVKDFPFNGVMNGTTKAAPMKSESDGEHPSSHYLVVENAFKPTTWHLRVRGKDGKPDHTLMGAAWAALHGGYRGNKYEGPGKTAAIADLKKLYAAENMTPPGEKSFSVFKQADGQYRWVTISSSAFRDRDGEIITEQALAEDVERCDTTKQYGPLRWFHLGGWEAPDGLERWDTWKATAGVDLGQCDFNMLHGKMLIESGTFKDAVTGEAFAEAQDNLEVSIGFSHPKDEPGKSKLYNNIHRFERSLLPAGMASNLLTRTYVVKGSNMKTQEKFDALIAILRNKPDLAKQILDDAENVQKAAEAAGLKFKDVEEMISTPTEPETEEVIQSPAAETEVKKPEEEKPAEEVPVIEAEKAAPPPPPAEPAPEEIGDWTPQQLAEFCAKVYQQMMNKKEAEAELKQAGRDQILSETLASLKALGERFSASEKSLEETKQALQELTDARPVGIKQLQNMRPTERADNVIKGAAPTGPQMDPDFVKFALGGK